MVCLSVQEFLDSTIGNTKKTYQRGLKTFFEWYKQKDNVNDLNELLELRKNDLTQKPDENIVDFRFRAKRFEREIEKFFDYMVKQGKSANTAKTHISGIKALFTFYAMPVKMRRGSRVNRPEKTNRNFPLTIEHVRKMYQVANLRDKVILSMATDLGWRIGDFLNIKINDLPDLDQEAPISFETRTQKCKVIAHGFLSKESVEVLKLHLKELEEKNQKQSKPNPYLFSSNGNAHTVKHISEEAVSKIFRKLVRQSRIKLNGKRLTFHCFRKMVLSASINSGVGITVGKKLVGKKIPESDDTYLTTLKLKEKFLKLKKFLTITASPEVETEEVKELKEIVSTLQVDFSKQKKFAELLDNENLRLKHQITQITEDKTKENKELKDRLLKLEKQIEVMGRIRDRSDLLMREILNDPRFIRLIKKKLSEGPIEVREDTKEGVKIHKITE